MSGLADEGNAVACGDLRHETGKRKHAARPDLSDGPEQTLQSRFKRAAERRIAECREPLRDRGRSTQTRLEDLPGEGTTVSGPAGRWNSVEIPSVNADAQTCSSRALLVSPLARPDAGGGPAKGLPAVAPITRRALGWCRRRDEGRRGWPDSTSKDVSLKVMATLAAAWRRSACVRTTSGIPIPER